MSTSGGRGNTATLIRELASYPGFIEDSVKVIDTRVQNREPERAAGDEPA